MTQDDIKEIRALKGYYYFPLDFMLYFEEEWNKVTKELQKKKEIISKISIHYEAR